MKKTSKPNISPFEVEIDNKVSLVYLAAVAAKANLINHHHLFKDHLFEKDPKPVTNHLSNIKKTKQHGK